ncbi:MAG: DNA cytosine methyltransferase [Dehalococcoidia bacterium]|jgi:DNA (cytosine-5)-methyltransferase 1
MNRYKHEIEKLIQLTYGEGNAKTTSKEKLGKFEKRVGNNFTIAAKTAKTQKCYDAHVETVCGDIPQCLECPIKKFCCYFRNQAINQIQHHNLKVVDLFCGAGGFSLGFTQAGFNIIFAIDNQECCVETYRHNHPEISEAAVLCKDIKIADDDIANIIDNREIDVVIGGPPCQGFSAANKQRMMNDPRNILYKHFVNAIEWIRPKFFVMENVEGILKIKDEVIEDFAALETKYNVIPIKVNAVDFGIPQNRRRIFFIGTRLNVDLSSIAKRIIKIANEQPKRFLDDVLNGLRYLEAEREKNTTMKDSELSGSIIEVNTIKWQNEYIKLINENRQVPYVFNHKARYNNERDIKIFSRLHPGDYSDDPKIADIMPYASRNDIFKDKYFRLQGDKPCKTITAHMKYDGNMYIHPSQARGLTPREVARIQSYPDDYFFCGPYTKTYMQIGNSVPPMVARAIAETIKFTIDFTAVRGY